jgi:hypothetical protein
MNLTKNLIAFGIAILFMSCVRSLHPLFDKKDLVFEPALVGTWAEKDSKNTWTFEKSGDKAYSLVYFEHEQGSVSKEAKGDSARFTAHLGRLGDFTFLDLFPEEHEENDNTRNTLYNLHILPAHTIWRVWLEADGPRLALLDNGWLKEMIGEKKVEIAHEEIDGAIVLTASTRQLQEFVLQHAEDADAFPNPIKLRGSQ